MTVNEHTMQGNWNQIKGMLKETWGELRDDDLDRIEGNADQLIGMLQEKTGETKADIEKELEQIVARSSNSIANAGEAIRNAASQAADTLNGLSEESRKQIEAGYIQAKRAVEAGYQQTRDVVKGRPVESLAVVFGVGLVTGVVASFFLRSRN